MRNSDFQKLNEQFGLFLRGHLPDLGRPTRKGGYRWSVGYVRVASGKAVRWREYLGHDLLLAQYRAREMTDVWLCHVDYCVTGALGKAHAENSGPVNYEEIEIPPMNREQAHAEAWTAAAEALAAPTKMARDATLLLQGNGFEPAKAPGFKLVALPTTAAAGVAELTHISSVCIDDLTLYQAAQRWLGNLKKRHAAGDVSESYIVRVETSTLPRIRELGDYRLASTGRAELEEIRLALQAKRTVAGSLRKRSTVRTELGHLRTLFTWLDESELWPNPPRRWEKLLRAVFRSDDHDDDPDKAKRHDIYSRGELCRLYASGGYSMRLWLLCVLNFGWGQTEIATARFKHFKTEKQDRRRVARYRHKRQASADPVPGRWTAWPETWDAAAARMKKTPKDFASNSKGLAFLTTQGQQLVKVKYAKKSGKPRTYDSIGEAFSATCKKAGVRDRGFYLLRHTAINAIKQIAGSEIADLYCQHAPETMSAKHYLNADWRKLRRALRSFRMKLQPMFDAASRKID